MSEWQAKRFWEKTTVKASDAGFAVLLDHRPLRTPAKSKFLVPTEKMALEIAKEWDAQTENIDPMTMPMTRTANAAIDKVKHQHSEVSGLIAAYGETDLLCYRANGPEKLIERQNAAWDPLLDWAAEKMDAPLNTGKGIVFVQQDQNSLDKLKSRVKNLDEFQLSAFYDLVALSGSLIIGFATIENFLPPAELWHRSRIDEDWQIEKWGEDEEAMDAILVKKQGFEHAANFYFLCK